jgi:hypothetical protein
VFSVRSIPRCYLFKRDKLGASVSHSVKRRAEGWCEMAASLRISQLKQESAVGYSPETVTRKRLVKAQKSLCVLQLRRFLECTQISYSVITTCN